MSRPTNWNSPASPRNRQLKPVAVGRFRCSTDRSGFAGRNRASANASPTLIVAHGGGNSSRRFDDEIRDYRSTRGCGSVRNRCLEAAVFVGRIRSQRRDTACHYREFWYRCRTRVEVRLRYRRRRTRGERPNVPRRCPEPPFPRAITAPSMGVGLRRGSAGRRAYRFVVRLF